MKKLSGLVFALAFLLLFSGCNVFDSKKNEALQNATDTTRPITQQSQDSITDNTSCIEETTSNTEKTTNGIEENDAPTEFVFNTENIERITFYSYYGQGRGSEVTADDMAEITRWLGTFTVDKKADDLLPPGTNTYYVEIEYLDGTVVKKGLDVVVIDGTSYYVNHAMQPACFMEIISKTS